MTHRFTHDVAIVGGGPAGLASAIAVRAAGMSAVVLDSMQPPIDKPCGEGLMPDGLNALADLGVHLAASDGYPFRGVQFTNGQVSAHADFPNGTALGIRRTVLHERLVEHAATAGAELRWGTPVSGIDGYNVHAGGDTLRARWIVGADGHSSMVRRWAGLDRCTRDKRRFGFRVHYPVAPWSDRMQLHWGPDCQIYVTPVAAREVCVVVMSDNPKLRLHEALTLFPELQVRLCAVEPTSSERGAVTSTRRLASVHRRNVALVGDASGSVDAITGEGLRLSFRHAGGLADALVGGDLHSYAVRHRAVGRRPAFMADFMLILSGRPRLRDRVVQAFSNRPAVFETMLASHVGAAPAFALAASVASLGWQLLVG